MLTHVETGAPDVLSGDVLKIGSIGSAVFSADGRRRRWLSRRLSPNSKRIGFVMLNPSKADADKPDPTITRCVGFALREGAGHLEVANLADIIETDSRKLMSFALTGETTDGNSRHYLRHVMKCDVVVAAWGAHKWARGKLAFWWSQEMGGELPVGLVKCLGKTASGAPQHPLYIKGDAPLLDWP